MEYLFEVASFCTLAHELKNAEVAALLQTGMAYKDLTLLLAVALFAMVFADQIAMVRGKFSSYSGGTGKQPAIKQQPFQQLFKNQLFAGFLDQSAYMKGAEQMGSLKFFTYNLLALGSWLVILLIMASGLRALWIGYFGSFGPFEVEMIAALLAVYLGLLVFSLIRR